MNLVRAVAVGALGLATGCSDAAKARGPASAGSAGSAGQSDDGGMVAGDGGAGGGGGDSGGDAGSAGTAELPPPWDERSASISLSCFTFFTGSMMFRADRAELSAAQLARLANLRRTANNDECIEDDQECTVTIVSEAGRAVTYRAEESDALCESDELAIAYDSLAPFLDTVHCGYAKHEGERVDPIDADSRCFNGVFSPYGGTTVEQPLNLAEAGRTYHIELTDCDAPKRAGNVTMQLFGNERETPIATGETVATPGPDGACLALDVTVEQPMSSARLVIQTNQAFLPAGDFFLRFY